jgi:uncharacterized membrane protein YphA (DoxX/SURF4 family)
METASSSDSIRVSARQAYWVLRVAFAVVPIVAGIDQFTDKLANWDMYLAPLATSIVPLPAHTLMMMAGAAEIVAGLIVAFAPRIGGWIVAIWLWLIIINLLVAAGFYDTVLRDLGLSLGAVALARLGAGFERARHVQPVTQSPMAGMPGKP